MTYPLAYPLASSQAGQTPRNGRASAVAGATKDLRPSVSLASRLSPGKLAAIQARLSDRDRAVMVLVGRFQVVSGAQLERLFWPEGRPATRARLARHGLSRLCRLGVLAALGRTVGGVRAGSSGRCFALGLAGQRLVAGGKPKRQPRYPYTPGERHLAHTLAVTETYVQLVEAQRWGLVEEIIAFDPEPSCWRTYLGPWGARLTLKPDAYCKLAAGAYVYSWLIEQDMATESSTTIERKAKRHLDYHHSGTEQHARGVAPRVIWIVPDEERARIITQILARLDATAQQLFAVSTTEAVVTVLTSEARS